MKGDVFRRYYLTIGEGKMASKGAADLAVQSYRKTYNLPAVIVRSINNFGPRQFPEKLIPKVIIHALKDKKIPVYGDGKAVRSWIYVKDFCKAILTVLEKGEDGEIYNIGSSNEMTNLELVQKILSHLGKDESLIKFVHDRPGHDLRYSLDSTKARRQLNWGEQYPFDLALANTISWYKYYFEHYATDSSIM